MRIASFFEACAGGTFWKFEEGSFGPVDGGEHVTFDHAREAMVQLFSLDSFQV